jgi:hypothetical protein
MSSFAQKDAWRRPLISFVNLNTDEIPLGISEERALEAGDLFRDNRGRILAVIGVGTHTCPCVIFDINGELATVDRIPIHRFDRSLRIGRLKEQPRWDAIWGDV